MHPVHQKRNRVRKKAPSYDMISDKTPVLVKVHQQRLNRSVHVTIPQALVNALGLHDGDDVVIWKDGDVLILRKIHLEVRADELFIS